MTLPPDSTKPALQTWPLKNRIITTDNVKKTAQQDSLKAPGTPGRPTSSATTIDDVAVEEKRLLNALNNGVVVNEEAPKARDFEPSVATKWGLRSTRRPEQTVPHPELTSSQRQHLRQTAANPVRPFLTRGSVAERVLIFERCPSDLMLDKRARAPVTLPTAKIQVSFGSKFGSKGRSVLLFIGEELPCDACINCY